MKDTDNSNNGWGPEKTSGAHARAPAPKSPKNGQNGRDSVAVTKMTRDDGAEVTTVVHPPRMLKTPGEIKNQYEAGVIGLEILSTNATEGLQAMKEVVTTNTRGSGQNRETSQSVTMVPDHAMRLKWQEHVTATVEGMPVKRQEIVSRKVTTEEDLLARARKSPALLKALLTQLHKLDDELSNKGGADSA